MSIFIGAVKRKGAYVIERGNPLFYFSAIQYDPDAEADGYLSFRTFPEAKKELLKAWAYEHQSYKKAISFWKKQKSIPNS